MAVLTVDEYKTLAQITVDTYDDLITAIIPLIEGDMKSICNRTFLDDTGAEDWPVGIELYATQMISFNINQLKMDGTNGMKSESQGGYSYTKDGDLIFGYPSSIMRGLARYRYISAKESKPLTQFRDRRYTDLQKLADDYRLYTMPGQDIEDINAIP
jgi:hypothetical protein